MNTEHEHSLDYMALPVSSVGIYFSYYDYSLITRIRIFLAFRVYVVPEE